MQVVEDMHTNYWTSHVDTPQSFIELCKLMIDRLHEPYLGHKEIHFRHEHPEAVSVLSVKFVLLFACVEITFQHND